MNLQIRKGIKEDAKGVVEVNTYTWLTTYKGLMPDEVLDKRLKTMNERISKVEKSIIENDNLYVATDNNKVIGIMTYGVSRNKEYLKSGEIYSIYVLDEYQGYGIGKQLFMTGIKELLNEGYNSMIANVLKGNKTIHFYEKYDSNIVDKKTDIFGNIPLTEYIMYFADLNEIYDNLNE